MTKAEQLYMAQERVEEYDRQTNQLAQAASKLHYVSNGKYTLKTIVSNLREAFKYKKIRNDVIGNMYLRPSDDFSAGFCFVSSYLIYSMTGGDTVWEIRDAAPMHWWLVHKETNTIFDITYSQMKPERLHNLYQNGLKTELNPNTLHLLQEKAHKLAQSAGLE